MLIYLRKNGPFYSSLKIVLNIKKLGYYSTSQLFLHLQKNKSAKIIYNMYIYI